jgi:hypothetical protein
MSLNTKFYTDNVSLVLGLPKKGRHGTAASKFIFFSLPEPHRDAHRQFKSSVHRCGHIHVTVNSEFLIYP